MSKLFNNVWASPPIRFNLFTINCVTTTKLIINIKWHVPVVQCYHWFDSSTDKTINEIVIVAFSIYQMGFIKCSDCHVIKSHDSRAYV